MQDGRAAVIDGLVDEVEDLAADVAGGGEDEPGVAEGGLDLRKQLISEGKVTTNGILFDSGSANIQPQSMGIILQISQVLKQESAMKLKIVGHTDGVPVRSLRHPTNLHLSQARAQAVADVLARRFADPARVVAEGRGTRDPIASEATAQGRARNRRVEILVR